MRNRIKKTSKQLLASISNNLYIGKDITTNQTFEKVFDVKCGYNNIEATKLKKTKVSKEVKKAEELFENFDTGNIRINGKNVGHVTKSYGLVCLLNKQQSRSIIKFPKIA